MKLGNFSISLAVKDLAASRVFYEKLGFKMTNGDGKSWVVRGDRNHCSASGGIEGLTKIAARQQAIVPVVAVQQQNVHLSLKLSMLKTIVQEERIAAVFSNGHGRRLYSFGADNDNGIRH